MSATGAGEGSRAPDWYELKELERNTVTLRTPCPTCQASEMRSCKALAGSDPAGTHNPWDGVEHFHPQRQQWARERYTQRIAQAQLEVMLAQQRLDDEIARTCPWCGRLYDTVILMEEHEVDCG